MKSNYVIYILLGVIFILLACIIFRKKDVKIITTDTSALEQQIKDKQAENALLSLKVDSLLNQTSVLYAQVDSLSTLKQKIKIEYREKYIYIDNATNQQLDSLIRSNW